MRDSWMSKVRRIDAKRYAYDNPDRYMASKDCMTEPEVLKSYYDGNPNAICLGGYGYFGCCPSGRRKTGFIRYDLDRKQYVRPDGKITSVSQTYCGRRIPRRV